jgi:hypothetical protein
MGWRLLLLMSTVYGYDFFRDVWIRTKIAAVAIGHATGTTLASHPSTNLATYRQSG